MKVIVDKKIPYLQGVIERLADEVVYAEGRDFTPELVRDAGALFVRTRTRCDCALLAGSRVRFIATATIGFDHIDTDFCRASGITWTNAPGCNAGGVEQYVEAALLLLERERGGFSAPNRLYVKVPPVPQVQFSDQLMAGSPPLIEPENRPTDGQKTDLMMVGKPSPNQTTINNLTESQTKGVSGGPSAPYGRYGNIFLSQTEYDELQAEYPDRLERFIEEMSRYLAANGKSYQNYAAALRIWAGNDKKEAPKKGIPDYSCKEGESL